MPLGVSSSLLFMDGIFWVHEHGFSGISCPTSKEYYCDIFIDKKEIGRGYQFS